MLAFGEHLFVMKFWCCRINIFLNHFTFYIRTHSCALNFNFKKLKIETPILEQTAIVCILHRMGMFVIDEVNYAYLVPFFLFVLLCSVYLLCLMAHSNWEDFVWVMCCANANTIYVIESTNTVSMHSEWCVEQNRSTQLFILAALRYHILMVICVIIKKSDTSFVKKYLHHLIFMLCCVVYLFIYT